jgi:predicted O-methyltransferase YrrM
MRIPDFRPRHERLNRSIYGLLGIRPPRAEHTRAEGALLREYARGRKVIVEIGVAEGVSAWEMRQEMADEGTLYLVDPYASRFGAVSPSRLLAHRLVDTIERGRAVWIEQFSPVPAADWQEPIDFLFIDGDHTYEGALKDWVAWTPHLAAGSHVALHDARLEARWTLATDGPVRVLKELRDSQQWTLVEETDSLAVLTRRATAQLT